MKNSAPTYRSVDQLSGDITPDLATWLEPAVMTILASHMPHSTDWGGFFCEDFEGFTHGDFGDEQDWREHVAPLITAHIVKAIETDWERASAVCVMNKPIVDEDETHYPAGGVAEMGIWSESGADR